MSVNKIKRLWLWLWLWLFALLFSVLMPRLAFAVKMPDYIWLSPQEIRQLPTTGKAWKKLKSAADKPLAQPNLSDQNDITNVRVLAQALMFVRTGQQSYRRSVINACVNAINTENGGTTLALGRGLMAYVIAAQLVELPQLQQERFTTWLKQILSKSLKGRTLRSTHQERPNNWGTHAGASRAAVAIYLKDLKELKQTAKVFRGWLGEREVYHNFKYKKVDRWQANPQQPLGINPKGSTKRGHNIDGVLPEEQRRAGKFRWPPPKEGYVWEALQGALSLAVILKRADYQPFVWSDKALLRAVNWLYQVADFPAKGDDIWLLHIVNHFYQTQFDAKIGTKPGKNAGWTDWTFGEHGIMDN